MTMTSKKNKMELDKKKVLLGLSGGVDSTTAALLLKEKGLEVTGYYFDICGTNETGRKEAQDVADQLGIPLIMEDVSARFDAVVVNNFCGEYSSGRTPNPCIVCNPAVKFFKLIQKANEIGAYYIATGHYARIHFDETTGFYHVRQGANIAKDQSYMLYRLGQDVLSRVIFPLGEYMDKEEIRSIARSVNLSNAEKKDSQEICFVPDDNYVKFLEERGHYSKPGDFVDKDGKVLGKHKGIVNYTIGQRKGLGIALGKPAFVTKIDPTKNQVVLGDNDDLFSKSVTSIANVMVGYEDFAKAYHGKPVLAKVRYSARPSEGVFFYDEATGEMTVEFELPQRAPTPGQSMVIYQGDLVLGGGFIK